MPRNGKKRRCEARTLVGGRCRGWAQRESEPPRCKAHGEGALPQGGKQQCTATTRWGKPCRAWAVSGQALCSMHAGLMAAGETARAAGRACTAMTRRGKRCQNWALRNSEAQFGHALCRSHAAGALPGRNAPADGRRCEAVTVWGQQCRNWATRDSRAEGEARKGKALCAAHAGRSVIPEAEEGRRCSAQIKAGGRCSNWAVWGTEERYGRLLCVAHLAADDARAGRARGRSPAVEARRCVAKTWEGRRCKRWARKEPEARGMCEQHAYPNQNAAIRHGYYRRVPYFSKAMRASLAQLAQEGEPLSAELVLVRLKLRAVIAYLGRKDLSWKRRNAGSLVAFRGVSTVARLLQARKKLKEVNWTADAAGGTGELLARTLEEEEA